MEAKKREDDAANLSESEPTFTQELENNASFFAAVMAKLEEVDKELANTVLPPSFDLGIMKDFNTTIVCPPNSFGVAYQTRGRSRRVPQPLPQPTDDSRQSSPKKTSPKRKP